MDDYIKKEDITLSEVIVNISKKFLNLFLLTAGIFAIILAMLATQIVFKIPTSHLYLEIKSNFYDERKSNKDFKDKEVKEKDIDINISDYLTIANLDSVLKKTQLNDYNSAELIRYISIMPATRGISKLKNYFNENQKIILKDLTIDINQIEKISNKLLHEANSRYEIQIDLGRSNLNIADASRIINNLLIVINSELKNNYKTSRSKLKLFSLLSDDASYISILDRLENLNKTIDNLNTNFRSYAPNINSDEMISFLNNIKNETRILASKDNKMKDTLAIKQIEELAEYQKKIEIINQILKGINREVINTSAGNDVIYEVGKPGEYEVGKPGESEFDTSFFETMFSIGRKIDLTDLRIRLINERKNLEFQKIDLEAVANYYASTIGITENYSKVKLKENISIELNSLTKQVNKYIDNINESDNLDDYFSISSPIVLEEGLSANYSINQIFLLFLLSIILSSITIYIKSIISRA